MSAEVLRRAAALMRERAEAASTEGEWRTARIDSDPPERGGRAVAMYGVTLNKGRKNERHDGVMALFSPVWARPEDATHVASWHPAVALAVADWLDNEAEHLAESVRIWAESSQDPVNRWGERGMTVESNVEHHWCDALKTARAYLGEQP